MLIAHAERYLALRQALGFKLREVSMNIRAFARFATARGDTYVRASTAADWATEGSSPNVRYIRLRDVVQFGRFLHAENPAHEVPANFLHFTKRRRLPYIYAPEELAQLLGAVSRLRLTYPLRREVYATMLGLIAATGLRVSEALDLRLGDVMPDGILQIRHAKFGKRRQIPLHPTAANALNRYLEARCRLAITDDHLFLSAGGRRIASSTVGSTFHQVTRLAGIAREGTRQPRLVDLRHSFATRALEQCSTRREAVARHFVALATYMGHSDIANTYWYLEATPELLTDIAAQAEALIAREDI
jgi:integrase/recombinase XerD